MEGAARPATDSPIMDRDFVVRNQIVERYLSGKLPAKGAVDFEHFCAAHPQLLDEIGLADRVNAGLRLLEAGGKPEPWREPAKPLWQRTPVLISLAAACLVLLLGVVIATSRASKQSSEIAALKKQVSDQPLKAATAIHTVRLIPERSGSTDTPGLVVGGTATQFTDLKIDESRSPYRSFRVAIDRAGEGRVLLLQNIAKDSNGDLRIGLNDSAFGSGNYRFTIEGLNWRGDAAPDSWVTLGIRH
jgi:hypothetical protein